MKRLFLIITILVVMVRCRDAKPSAINSGLHFSFSEPGDVEPVALLEFDGTYRQLYFPSGDPATGDAVKAGQLISEDLVSWKESARPLFPQYENKTIRGSIVKEPDLNDPLVLQKDSLWIALLLISEHGTNEGKPEKIKPVMATSIDGGNTWKERKDTVRLPASLIDHPQNMNIFWYRPTARWIMDLAVDDHLEIYSSADMRIWDYESSIGKDFFPEGIQWKRTILFEGDENHHWVLLGDIKRSGTSNTSGGTVYFIGNFDGHHFSNLSSQLHWLDYGDNIYGTCIARSKAGERIYLGWNSPGRPLPTKKKLQGNTLIFTRQLGLKEQEGEWFIIARTVPEIAGTRKNEIAVKPLTISYKVNSEHQKLELKTPVEMVLEFNTQDLQKGSFPLQFGVSFWNRRGEHLVFGYDRFGYYYMDRSGLNRTGKYPAPDKSLKMPFTHEDSTLSLHFIIDASVIECFTEDGKLIMTDVFSVSEPFERMEFFSVNGTVDMIGGRMMALGKN